MRKHPQTNNYRPFLSLLASISISLLTISCECSKPTSDQNQNENQAPTLKLQLIAQGPTYLVGDNKDIYLKVEQAADSIAVNLSELKLQSNRKLGDAARLVWRDQNGSLVWIDQNGNKEVINDKDKIPVQALGGIGALIKVEIEEGNDTETAFAFQLFYENKPIGNELTFTWRSKLGADAQELLNAIQDSGKTKDDIKQLITDRRMSNVNIADSRGDYLLHHAAGRNDVHAQGIVELLLDKGADIHVVNKFRTTPLLSAVMFGSEAVVKLLLNAKSQVNVANEEGFTPLGWAASEGNLEIAELLLTNGAKANINQVDRYESTSLMSAASNGHLEVVRLLLNNGAQASINQANKYKNTPLMAAAFNGHLEVVRLLLDKGAEANKADKTEDMPLYLAVRNGNRDIIELLLEAGANPDLKVGDQTIRDLAEIKGPGIQALFAHYPKK